jgi:hypothetical protein
MAVTTAARVQTALHATTDLSVDDAVAIVKKVAEEVMETGRGRKEGKWVKSEVRPRVTEDHGTWVRMEIGSGWETSSAWTVFTAVAEPVDGRTALRIGGLEKYRIFQSKFLGLIPSGPATIFHFGLYKRYLQAVSTQLRASDPGAVVTIGVPQ